MARARFHRNVDIEDDAALGPSKSTKIEKATFTAGLHFQSGDWRSRQVGDHDPGGPAIEGKMRLQHSGVPDRQQLPHSTGV
jgi:hypothetical protein